MIELIAEVVALDGGVEETSQAGGTLGQRVELLERTMSVLQMQVGLMQIQVQGLKAPAVEKPKRDPGAERHYGAGEKVNPPAPGDGGCEGPRPLARR